MGCSSSVPQVLDSSKGIKVHSERHQQHKETTNSNRTSTNVNNDNKRKHSAGRNSRQLRHEHKSKVQQTCLTTNVSPTLNSHHKRLIKSTWDIIPPEDYLSLGLDIFMKIFKNSPEIMKIFGMDSCLKEEVMNHPVINAHAAKFVQIIQSSVDNVGRVRKRLDSRCFEPRPVSPKKEHRI